MSSRAEQQAAMRHATRPVPRERIYVDGEGYDLVVDSQRCDRQFENEEADRRRDAFLDERTELTASMRQQRAGRPLRERIDEALFRLARVENVRARKIASVRDSSNDDTPGGKRPPGSTDRELTQLVDGIATAITRLEWALDEEEGIAPPTNRQHLSTLELDRALLTECAGMTAKEINEQRPELGSRATVYRKRHLAGFTPTGLDPITGDVPTPAAVRHALDRLTERSDPEATRRRINREAA